MAGRPRNVQMSEWLLRRRRVDKNGCWLWMGHRDEKDYGRVTHRGRITRVHRVAHEIWKKPPGKLCVCHHCDVPACFNPDHLFLGTRADNAADRDRKGRGYDRNGEKNGRAKLKTKDVKAIRKDQRPESEIAEEYGVSHGTVWFIKRRMTWKSVT